MKSSIYILILFFLFGLSSCFNSCHHTSPQTVAIHNPIYPRGNSSVTFSLLLKNTGGEAKKVVLKVKERNIQLSGTIDPYTPEVVLQTWNNPVHFNLSHTAAGGFLPNHLVTYIFTVTDFDGNSYDHEVTFATNPYPFSFHPANPAADLPAPVYVTGHMDASCDVVFIPDLDLTGLANWQNVFNTSVRENILNGIFNDPYTQQLYQSYSFYINPAIGQCNQVGLLSDHDYFQPLNYANLSSFEGRCFIHHLDFVDYANPYIGINSFSCEDVNRGTFMHEGGHVLYYLDDEYKCGAHWQYRFVVPEAVNNWSSLTAAQAAAPSYGLNNSNISELNVVDTDPSCPSTSPGIFILCPYEGCQMGMTGLNITPYGKPCQHGIYYWLDRYIP